MIEHYREITFTFNFQNLSSVYICIFDESLVIKKSVYILDEASVTHYILLLEANDFAISRVPPC